MMADLTALAPTFATAFLSALVEVVEAFTIVLAVAVTRGWRPALTGAGLALALLLALVAGFGPMFALIPLEPMRFVVGVALILFGLRWLRKAILRASGLMALHDELAEFARETDLLARQSALRQADYLAGIAAFKAVLLEGTEVVFIVIAVGSAHGRTLVAGAGAISAVVLVAMVGALAHRPLSQVPENALKFTVGVMLTGYGIFWAGEGLGASWPGGDLALLWIVALLAGFSAAAVALLRRAPGAVAR